MSDEIPDHVVDDPEDRKGAFEDATRETIANGRYEIPIEGDLFSITYAGGYSVKSGEGIVEDVQITDTGVDIVADVFDTEGVSFHVDYTGSDQSEIQGFSHGGENAHQLHRTKVLVPKSQVNNPGVSEGDHVKVRMYDRSYYVKTVEDGRVELSDPGSDDWSVPVTQVTAFDEDVDDYDPLETFWSQTETRPPVLGPERPDGPDTPNP